MGKNLSDTAPNCGDSLLMLGGATLAGAAAWLAHDSSNNVPLPVAAAAAALGTLAFVTGATRAATTPEQRANACSSVTGLFSRKTVAATATTASTPTPRKS